MSFTPPEHPQRVAPIVRRPVVSPLGQAPQGGFLSLLLALLTRGTWALGLRPWGRFFWGC